jgi:hypothetical protein
MLCIRAHRNDGTTDIVDFFFGGVAAEVENPLPQTPLWVHAKESFTRRDKTRYVEDGIGSELM